MIIFIAFAVVLFAFIFIIGCAFEQYKSPLQVLFETLGILLVVAGCGACVFMLFLL